MLFYLHEKRAPKPMSITTFFAIFALVVLLCIAAELYVIARELSRGITIMLKEREFRDDKMAGQASAQTINVNLSPAQTGAQVSTTSGLITGTGDSPGASPVLPVQNSIPAKSALVAETKSTESGQFARKCSRCQAENSSYRHECFNCGASL